MRGGRSDERGRRGRGGRGGGGGRSGPSYNAVPPPGQQPSGNSTTPSSGGGRRGRGSRGRGRSPFPSNFHSKGARDHCALFGTGLEAVRYEKENKNVWKVGPPEGQRFQLAAFLRGLTAFVEFKRGKQHSAPSEEGGNGTAALEDQFNSLAIAPPEDSETGVETTSGESETAAVEPHFSPSTEALEDTSEERTLQTPQSSGNGSRIGVTEEADPSQQLQQQLLSSPSVSDASGFGPTPWPATPETTAVVEDAKVEADTAAELAEPASAVGGAASHAAATSRGWWPLLNPATGPMQLSLRLEGLELTDGDAALVADWVEAAVSAGAIEVRKLWLFGNRLGDEGAAAAARVLQACPATLTEVHLSHNLISLVGARLFLEAVPTEASRLSSPLWLRLEWNRISMPGLIGVLETQHAQRGLLADIPSPCRPDAAAQPLQRLPRYLEEAAAAAVSSKEVSPGKTRKPLFSGGAAQQRNQLVPVLEQCHCRLPWLSSQFEVPSEAAVLQTAKNLYRTAAAAAPTSKPPKQQKQPAAAGEEDAAAAAATPVAAAVLPPSFASVGPLLLVPDTSALLAMVGAEASMTPPTFFTLQWLLGLAEKGQFGRSLPPAEQSFVIVPASVATQLDALKTEPGARTAVRRFMGRGLDAMGPAGADFLSVLSAHEGEGLVIEHSAEVAGSRGVDVASKGQRTDHRIVEVALFFQQECMAAMAACSSSFSSLMPVVLLTSDNGQARLARAHGLPAVLMTELAAKKKELTSGVKAGQPLTASAVRAALRDSALTGLGQVAARSLQTEFDGAVACLKAAVGALVESRKKESIVLAVMGDESLPASEKIVAAREALASQATGEEALGVEDVQRRLKEWEARLRSVQTASRVLKWRG